MISTMLVGSLFILPLIFSIIQGFRKKLTWKNVGKVLVFALIVVIGANLAIVLIEYLIAKYIQQDPYRLDQIWFSLISAIPTFLVYFFMSLSIYSITETSRGFKIGMFIFILLLTTISIWIISTYATVGPFLDNIKKFSHAIINAVCFLCAIIWVKIEGRLQSVQLQEREDILDDFQ